MPLIETVSPQGQGSEAAPTGGAVGEPGRPPRGFLKRWAVIGAVLGCGFVTAVGAAYLEALWAQPIAVGSAPVSLTQHRPQGRPFDLGSLRVPQERILSGGPPKDGIPALSLPRTAAANGRDAPRGPDRVIGVTLGGQSRAYPIAVLNHHEIVNDRLGETPIAVTYCPLCDSALVFDRRTPVGEREFGVSGLLYNSNVLMYDRSGGPSDSLWSQLAAAGVSGAASGARLTPLPFELTTWEAWRARHPQSDALSIATGHQHDYRRNPYAGYFQSPELMFPAEPVDSRLPAKERVLGLWTEDGSLAVPAKASAEGKAAVRVAVGGKRAVLEYDPGSDTLRVLEADDGVRWMYSLWFAWYAFHPETDIYGPPAAARPQ